MLSRTSRYSSSSNSWKTSPELQDPKILAVLGTSCDHVETYDLDHTGPGRKDARE